MRGKRKAPPHPPRIHRPWDFPESGIDARLGSSWKSSCVHDEPLGPRKHAIGPRPLCFTRRNKTVVRCRGEQHAGAGICEERVQWLATAVQIFFLSPTRLLTPLHPKVQTNINCFRPFSSLEFPCLNAFRFALCYRIATSCHGDNSPCW